jgi:transposase
MATVSALPARDTLPGRFAAPPWADDHPRRLDLDARLAPDHLARQVEQAVARLDLTALYDAYAGTGSLACRPDLLLRLALYAVRRGRHSPADWWRDARENEPARWLLRGLTPSRSCWYAFRDRVGPLLRDLNDQPLRHALAHGLTPLAQASLDGTTVAANASRHQLVNATKVGQRLAQLAQALAADNPSAAASAGWSAPAPPVAGVGGTTAAVDHAAPRTTPGPAALVWVVVASALGTAPLVRVVAAPTVTTAVLTLVVAAPAVAVAPRPLVGAAALARPRWMAATPTGRQQQWRRLHQARACLAERQTRNQGKRPCKRKAADTIVLSPADPEAVVGRDKEWVYRPLYNIQILDDLDSPFILAYDVLGQQNDAGTMGPLLQRLRAGLDRQIERVLVDSAYAGGADLAAAAAEGVTVYAPVPGDGVDKAAGPIPKRDFTWQAAEQTYLCPQGHRLLWVERSRQKRSGTELVVLDRYRCPAEHCAACPLRQRCAPQSGAGRAVVRSEYEAHIEALRARMATPAAKALYRLRGQTVERVNADWKQHRKLRRFSSRGLARVRGEVGLIVLAHNVLALRAETAKAAAPRAAAATPPGITT